jgi:hypothetical protein
MSNSEQQNREDSETTKCEGMRQLLLVIFAMLCIVSVPVIGLTAAGLLNRGQTKIDVRFATLMESVLNLQTRVDSIEKENQVLFKMLRNENGLVPEPTTVSPPVTLPLNPVTLAPTLPPPRKIGDVVGDAAVGDAAVGDAAVSGDSGGDGLQPLTQPNP